MTAARHTGGKWQRGGWTGGIRTRIELGMRISICEVMVVETERRQI